MFTFGNFSKNTACTLCTALPLPLAAGKSAKTGSVFKIKYRFVQFVLSGALGALPTLPWLGELIPKLALVESTCQVQNDSAPLSSPRSRLGLGRASTPKPSASALVATLPPFGSTLRRCGACRFRRRRLGRSSALVVPKHCPCISCPS